MHIRKPQSLPPQLNCKSQAGAFVRVAPSVLGLNGDFRFMMLLGVRGSRLLCPAPSDTCTRRAQSTQWTSVMFADWQSYKSCFQCLAYTKTLTICGPCTDCPYGAITAISHTVRGSVSHTVRGSVSRLHQYRSPLKTDVLPAHIAVTQGMAEESPQAQKCSSAS